MWERGSVKAVLVILALLFEIAPALAADESSTVKDGIAAVVVATPTATESPIADAGAISMLLVLEKQRLAMEKVLKDLKSQNSVNAYNQLNKIFKEFRPIPAATTYEAARNFELGFSTTRALFVTQNNKISKLIKPIKCIKGNTTIIVKDIDPQCPKGSKKK